jgi:hypothetical protein
LSKVVESGENLDPAIPFLLADMVRPAKGELGLKRAVPMASISMALLLGLGKLVLKAKYFLALGMADREKAPEDKGKTCNEYLQYLFVCFCFQ